MEQTMQVLLTLAISATVAIAVSVLIAYRMHKEFRKCLQEITSSTLKTLQKITLEAEARRSHLIELKKAAEPLLPLTRNILVSSPTSLASLQIPKTDEGLLRDVNAHFPELELRQRYRRVCRYLIQYRRYIARLAAQVKSLLRVNPSPNTIEELVLAEYRLLHTKDIAEYRKAVYAIVEDTCNESFEECMARANEFIRVRVVYGNFTDVAVYGKLLTEAYELYNAVKNLMSYQHLPGTCTRLRSR